MPSYMSTCGYKLFGASTEAKKKGYLIDCYSSQHGCQCCPEKYILKGKMTAEGKAFLFLPEAVQKTEIKQNHTGFIL